jgi:GcrA cell cycle regulator
VAQVWTNKEEAVLREKVALGWTARMIGELLHYSRNAVISKCHRSGLKLTSTSKGFSGANPREKGPPKKAKSSKVENLSSKEKGRMTKPRQKPKPKQIYVPAPPPVEPMVPFDAPRGAGEAVAELANRGCVCHWPHGDPTDDGFTFCFAPRSPYAQQPYCDFHLGRSRASASPPAG